MWKIVAAGVGLGGIGFAIWLYKRRNKRQSVPETKIIGLLLPNGVRGVKARHIASQGYLTLRARTGVYPHPRPVCGSGMVEKELALGILEACGLVQRVYIESPETRCSIPRSRQDLIRLGLIRPAVQAN